MEQETPAVPVEQTQPEPEPESPNEQEDVEEAAEDRARRLDRVLSLEIVDDPPPPITFRIVKDGKPTEIVLDRVPFELEQFVDCVNDDDWATLREFQKSMANRGGKLPTKTQIGDITRIYRAISKQIVPDIPADVLAQMRFGHLSALVNPEVARSFGALSGETPAKN
jgi:hypothetical protein